MPGVVLSHDDKLGAVNDHSLHTMVLNYDTGLWNPTRAAVLEFGNMVGEPQKLEMSDLRVGIGSIGAFNCSRRQHHFFAMVLQL